MFFPGAAVYMEKIAAGADAVDAIDINATPTENVQAVAKAKGRRVTDIRVVVLERDRHETLIGELREAGARVNLIRDGDVAPGDRRGPARDRRRPALRDRRHPGGRHLGGRAQVRRRRHPGQALAADGRGARRRSSRRATTSTGCSTTDDLVASDDVFVAATGVTTGALLRGVRYVNDGAVTDSLVMRSRSGTVRRIEARHKLSKLRHFTGREY